MSACEWCEGQKGGPCLPCRLKAHREQVERETIARVVALLDKHTVECDANHHLDAVAALAWLRDELTSGTWKEDGDG